MQTLTRLAPRGGFGRRRSLSDMFGHVKRAWAARADRRALRPLQDLDQWSDQTEMAFYEDCRSARCA